MESFDVVVIGSGPAGERAAQAASYFGKRVAVVERGIAVGGSSTNTGTIPSKTLRETALALSGFRTRKLYGVDLSLRREATIGDFMYHEARVKDSERERIKEEFDTQAIVLMRGTARFADPHVIEVTGNDGSTTQIKAEKVLIATGSSPVHPPGFAFESDLIHDSDEILGLKFLPRKLAVVGAGVIGSEYACTFAALGVEVHLLDGRDRVLSFLDPEMSEALSRAMGRAGVRLHMKEKVVSCTVTGERSVEVGCDSGLKLDMEGVLVAAGRRSNTEVLNLGAAGVETGERGLLTVNQWFQTNVPHIYAAGDVIGFPALAATSAEQGRVAMCHAFEFREKGAVAGVLPTGIYTIPEVSYAGKTEAELQKDGTPYVVGKAMYSRNARGKIIGDLDGFLKLLFRKDDMKLLGVHVIGEHATEVVHIGLIAMNAGATAELFNNTCFNYPTLGDLYKEATYQAMMLRYRGTGS